jgi:YNFM family putative membrane transporter
LFAEYSGPRFAASHDQKLSQCTACISDRRSARTPRLRPRTPRRALRAPEATKPSLASIYALVACAFTTVYVTQPILPVLQREFAVGASTASLSVSAVILGMALFTVPIGMLADRYPVRRLLLVGGTVVGVASLVCAITSDFVTLIAMRALQGAFMPTLTTCTAAWLSRTLPPAALNLAMGSYVAATVAGGLGGRLLGGFIHPPLHWRYAFVTSAVALLAMTLVVASRLREPRMSRASRKAATSIATLVVRRPQVLAQIAAFGAFGAFSTAFNYFPFYLSNAPWGMSTGAITSLYLVYIVGLAMGPLAGRFANRFGNGAVMVGGALLVAASLAATLVVSLPVLVMSLLGLCAGFFAVHAAAVGALNRSLSSDRGLANALYTLFYYVGGAVGIAFGGLLYGRDGWPGVLAVSIAMALLPLAVGVVQWDRRSARRSQPSCRSGT